MIYLIRVTNLCDLINLPNFDRLFFSNSEIITGQEPVEEESYGQINLFTL